MKIVKKYDDKKDGKNPQLRGHPSTSGKRPTKTDWAHAKPRATPTHSAVLPCSFFFTTPT